MLLRDGGILYIADAFSEVFFKSKTLGKALYEGMYPDCLATIFNLDDLADSSMGDSDLLTES